MSKERGSTPIELALGLMLIVVPVALMALLVAPVFEARNFVRRAAAEAARAGVVAVDDPLGAATATLTAISAGLGMPPESVSVVYCEGSPCSWSRGATFVVEVAVKVEEVSELLPIGPMTISARHAEHVDLYRSRP